MNKGSRRDIMDLPLRDKALICLVAAVLHVLIFFALYPVFGRLSGSVGIVFVAIVAWLFGTLPSIAAAFFILTLTIALVAAKGDFTVDALINETNWPGFIALFGMTFIIGQLRTLSLKLRSEVTQRQQAEQREVEARALAESLHITGDALSSTFNLNEIMQLILSNLWRVVPHDAANIMVIEGRIARVTAHRGYTERGLEDQLLAQRLIVDELPTFKKLVDEAASVLIPDVKSYSKWVQLDENSWIESFVSAPIVVDGKVIGVINLDSMTPNFFTKEDVKRLEIFANQAAIAIRNGRFVAVSQEKVGRLELISQIGQRTTSILDLDKLLHESAWTINDLFGYYMTVIWLVEDDLLFIKAHSNKNHRPFDQFPPLKIGEEGLCGWVAEHGEPLLVSDAKADPRYVEFNVPIETRSELVVPIRIKGVTIGVIDAQSDKLNAFAEMDVTTLQTVGDQLAIAIQNARLYERIQRRQGYLEALNRVNRSAVPERDPERYIQAVTDSLYEQFHYSRVLVTLGDDEKRELRIVARTDDKGNTLDEERRAFRQPYSRGIVGRVMTTKKPYLARDTTTDKYFVSSASGVEILSELAVPIKSQGKTIGVLTVQSTRKDNFDELDLEVMAELGELLGVNLQNVELNVELQKHAEDLEVRVARRTSELKDAKERLEELDKMKSKFVADVSHELRIPVTNLSLYIDLLDKGSEERRADYIRVFREQVGRLGMLVESILNLSRLELTRKRVKFKTVNLNDIIQPIVDAYSTVGEETAVSLVFDKADKLPDVQGQPDQLMQAVNHIVANAMRYTKEGEVRLTTSLDRKKWLVKLTVEDAGMGISADDLEHVFERFYRGSGTAQSDMPGAGLGLAVAHEIVELHKGEIEIDSEVGKGTTVTVTLPMKKMG